jgi:hypothetical protein
VSYWTCVYPSGSSRIVAMAIGSKEPRDAVPETRGDVSYNLPSEVQRELVPEQNFYVMAEWSVLESLTATYNYHLTVPSPKSQGHSPHVGNLLLPRYVWRRSLIRSIPPSAHVWGQLWERKYDVAFSAA